MQARQAFRILFSSACRTSLGHLSFICLLALTLTSCCSSSSQAKIKEPPKNKIIKNWTTTKITLYRSPTSLDSFRPGDAVEEIKAKKAIYNLLNPSVGNPDESVDLEFEFITFADPKSGRIYLGFPHPYFTETKSGIFGMNVRHGILWKPGLVDVSVSAGGLKEAISRFEKQYDAAAIAAHFDACFFLPGTDLDTALGRDFFMGASSGGTPDPRILSIKITGQIMELKIESPIDKSIGDVWVDMETRAVVKALRDGKTPPPPWLSEPPPPPIQTTNKF